MDFDNPESQLNDHLASINQFSLRFLQANSEHDIILLVLQEAIKHTQSFGATYIPSDDTGPPLAVISQDQVWDSNELETWEGYFSAPSIRSQCKICRKNHPINAICPLLNNPCKEAVGLFCIHLKIINKKLGVANLYLRNGTIIQEETQTYLTTIANIAALAIFYLRTKTTKKIDVDQYNRGLMSSKERSQTIREIQRTAILNERSRLAREFHDGLAQILGYVKLQLSQSIEFLEAGKVDKLNNSIQNSYQAISDAYVDTREVIDDLHNIPYSENFVDWLMNTIKNFKDNNDIHVDAINWPKTLAFKPMIHTHLIRMIQEILSNIRKHAKASKVQATYIPDDNCMILEIRDDGIGIPQLITPDQSQHGLRSLRERAEIIDADLKITGTKGQGTIVQIRLSNDKLKF